MSFYLIAQLDDLCYLYLDFYIDHLFQHPDNREIGYSNVLQNEQLCWNANMREFFEETSCNGQLQLELDWETGED